MIDPAAIADEIATVAAEEILPRFGKLTARDVRQKKPNDLVTVADEAVERRLSAFLGQLMPSALIVGEEACAADPDLLARLTGAEAAWIIDPLDGTANFTRSKPAVAVIVALVVGGQVQAGWIHDPFATATVIAERGSGAFRNGVRLSLDEPRRDTWPLGSVHVKYFPEPARRRLIAEMRSVTAIDPLWCAGREHLRVAEGETDFAVFRHALPWDHAAGTLIVAEAGGVVSHLDGSPYQVVEPTAGLMVARCAETLTAVRERLLVPAAAG
jgi:fructose-1,6-bisphosphatase/inositol monophosphatase family enzyme